mmetsp:Transcript_23976/g.50900  ORF Transcript_23976/g.50900 Transcript_23976/m.50900 type:complete len:228 (-) Transcript_23976:372-1055(-)
MHSALQAAAAMTTSRTPRRVSRRLQRCSRAQHRCARICRRQPAALSGQARSRPGWRLGASGTLAALTKTPSLLSSTSGTRFACRRAASDTAMWSAIGRAAESSSWWVRSRWLARRSRSSGSSLATWGGLRRGFSPERAQRTLGRGCASSQAPRRRSWPRCPWMTSGHSRTRMGRRWCSAIIAGCPWASRLTAHLTTIVRPCMVSAWRSTCCKVRGNRRRLSSAVSVR